MSRFQENQKQKSKQNKTSKQTQKNQYGEEQRKTCDVLLNFEFSLWVYFKADYVHFIFNTLNKDVQSKQVQFDYSSGF